MKKRWFSMALVVTMLLTSVDITVVAQEISDREVVVEEAATTSESDAEYGEEPIEEVAVESLLSSASTLIWPVPGHTSLSSGYMTSARPDHKGIDVWDSGISGETVVAAIGGTVITKYTCNENHLGTLGDCLGFGNGLIIKGDDGRYYQYAHMEAGSIPTGIEEGSTVSAGQAIGHVGNTGNSSGAHLHFQISVGSEWGTTVNPMSQAYVYDNPIRMFQFWGWEHDGVSMSGRPKIWFKSLNYSASSQVNIYVDDNLYKIIYPDSNGYYSFYFETYQFTSSQHKLSAILVDGDIRVGLIKYISIDNTKPIGEIESVQGGVGGFTVQGWALDWDYISKPVEVHVYDGPLETGTLCYTITANSYRASVEETYPGAGEYHGVSETISTDKTGEQTYYFYAMNIGVGSESPLIGKYTVTITPKVVRTFQFANWQYDGVSISGRPKIGFQSKNCSSSSQVNVYVDDNLYKTIYPDSSGNYAFYFETYQFSSSQHKLSAILIDGDYRAEVIKYVTIDNTKPIGAIDSVQGGTLTFTVQGWALDWDDRTKPIKVYVYDGPRETGTLCHTITADSNRAAVENTYPGAGEYHGISETITTDKAGERTFYFYAINTGLGSENPLIGKYTVTVMPDTESPVVTKASVTQQDENGFTVTAKVTDNINVEKVVVDVWSNAVGEWKENATTRNADGSFSHRVNHVDYEYGQVYEAVFYAYDKSGNCSEAVKVRLQTDYTSPVVSDVKYERISEDIVRVSCRAEDAEGYVSKVCFPTWTDYKGQDDLVWDWDELCIGTKEDDEWVWYVYDSQHNYEKGFYYTHIYAYDNVGNSSFDYITYYFENRYTPVTFTYNEHKYEIYNDLLSWSEAKAKCEELGGHLVTITSQGEQDVIMEAIQSQPRLSYFIGGRTVDGNSTWITGEEFSYTYWYPGEPNNMNGTENVYLIWRDRAGQWNDADDIQYDKGFICEYEPDAGDIVLPDDIPEEGVPEGLWIAGIEENGYPYTGKEIKPDVRVYDGETRLRKNIDYTITYKNNTKANDASNPKTAPTVTVTGKGNYSNKETATFVILQKDVSDGDITVADISLKATGKVQKASPVVKWNGKTLKKNKDYKLEYPSDVEGAYKDVGIYEIKIIGKGNFCGERTVQMLITGSNIINKATVAKVANQSYTGEEIKPALTVKNGKILLTEGIDYTVTYSNNVDVGTATAVITGAGAYVGEKRITFKIVGTPMSKVKVTELPKSVIYKGEPIDDVNYLLQIKVNNEMLTLVENQDFVVSYKKNTGAGTATIIFTGINGFSGTLKKTFKITAYDIAKDTEQAVEVPARLSTYFMKGSTTVEPKVVCFGKTLVKGKDYTLKYANNKKVGENKATVTITGKGNYKGKITLNFTIEQQNLARLTMTATDKVYQNKANKFASAPVIKDLNGKTLKAGTDYEKALLYTYTYNTELADGTTRLAGTPIAKTDILPAGTAVTVTATGKGNYAGELSCTYRIVKANLSKATAKIATQTYTGKAITLEKADIPLKIGKNKLEETDFEIVSYSNNIRKGTATVIVKGTGNYGGTKKLTFKIKAKKFSWWWR